MHVARYSIQIKPSAVKELDVLDDSVFGRIDAKIMRLADDPRPAGCKKLIGHRDLWRIRIGDWRIIYIIDDRRQVVSITRVAHRREVYE